MLIIFYYYLNNIWLFYLIIKNKKAANNVRALADQTIRAIQPMKCSGAKCVTPINQGNPMGMPMPMGMPIPMGMPMPMQMPDFGLQSPGQIPMGIPPIAYPGPTPTAIEAMMQPPSPLAIPGTNFNNFVFKQKNRFGNLRG